MIKTFNFVTIMFLYQLAAGQYQNILIGNTGDPEEPSICIDPVNPRYMVAGANINLFYYSSDTGRTWVKGNLTSSYGVWGDPCIVVDTAGAFYFFHLSNPLQGNWIDRIVCQKSVNHGVNWNNGSYTFLNGAKEQDKEWAVVDRRDNTIYVSWTQFDNYGSYNHSDSTHILFARSNDGGITWNTIRRIDQHGGDCIDSDNTVEGAVPALGPNGEIYIAWSGPLGIMFDKSTDKGDTWLENDIFVSSQPGGWDYDIPGIQRCNGLPVTVCDTGNSPYRGTIYINWTDQRNGTDNTDVWISKSTDNGLTWCNPIKVNDDTTQKHQFFTWLTIDQTNGNLYCIFYDRRKYETSYTDVYLAISKDGGNSFENICISDSPFLPNSYVFFGDYTNIVAHNNIVRPIWTRLDGEHLSLYTALINMGQTTVENNFNNYINETQIFPNPASEKIYFSFKIRQPDRINLFVADDLGRKITQIYSNKFVEPGKYTEFYNTSGLTPGIYYFVFNTSTKTKIKKFIIR